MTGANASGKGEAAAHLARRGFHVHSLSDIVREAARDFGLAPTREHLIEVGNRIRRENGPGALAERILPRIGTRDVVDSIRTPAEVAALRRLPHFVLVGLRATVETRFARACARKRPGDPRTLAEFRTRESQENTGDPAAQQLDATLALADHVVDNDGSLVELQRALDRFLDEPSARVG